MQTQNHHIGGIAWMLAAVGLFAVVDTAMKQLVLAYPPMQVSFIRSATSVLVVLAPLPLTRRWAELRMARPALHLLRALFGVVMLVAYVEALSELSLSNTYAIFLSAPLFIAALAALLLGERVGWHRWLGIGAGLVGVIVILRPTSEGIASVGGLAALLAALCYAGSAITVRVLGRTDSTASMVFWYLFGTSVITGVLAVNGWVPVRLEHVWWIVVLGVTGAVAQYALTEAFRRAPASSVAPFEYTALLWGIAFDWVLWRVLPTFIVLLGGAIIIGGGLYVLYRERRLAQ